MQHTKVLELAQLGAQGVDSQASALNDLSTSGRTAPECADDRQSNGIPEHYGGLGDKFRLAFGAHYGGHVVHLV
ncbi:hypothetical protein [Kocuria rosea]|uniref:hypothetical protein n=1 Tax=Kocuria rosea TaxID=1275 RepID=UPI0021B6625E|nr:hypothetical protein [Kocuria rosea]